MRASLSAGVWYLDAMNLMIVEIHMKSPATFLQMISTSDELDQSSNKSQSLQVLEISARLVLRNSLISLSTEEHSTSWSLRTSVMG